MGGRCVYSTDTPSTCINRTACDTYVPYQGAAPDNLISQTFCSTLKSPSGEVCTFTSGTAKCVAT